MKDRKLLNNAVSIRSREIEKKISKASLDLEKKLVIKELEVISNQFKMEKITKDGIQYIKRIKGINVNIGRVSVYWERPVFEGSKKGRTIYYYPADELLSPPKKTRASYETLSISALLGAFVPYSIVAYIMSIIRGVFISSSSIQRYTETVGQFASENLDEILEGRKNMINLKKDEILIASIDGSSSMINEKKRKGKKKKIKSKKKSKKDYLREAKVFRLSVYNTSTSRIVRTIFAHSIIRTKEEVLIKLKSHLSKLEISEEITIYALGDGAKWVKDVLESLHNNVRFTLDYYHAAGYLKSISELKYFTRHKQGKNAGKKYRKILKMKGGKKIIQDLKKLKLKINTSNLTNTQKEIDCGKIDKILEYMVPRSEQMNYSSEIEHGRPIGSGFIESACKYVVKQRLCLSGARFCLEDAERVMQLRCLIMMQAWGELNNLMFKKCFNLKHCCPSSSYEPVIPRKLKAA